MFAQGRCAAIVLCGNQLALLPGTGMDSLDAMVEASSLTTPATLGSSYMVSLPKLGVKEVAHLAYSQPWLTSSMHACIKSGRFQTSLFQDSKSKSC